MTVRELLLLYLTHGAAVGLHNAESLIQRQRRFAAFAKVHGDKLTTDCQPWMLSDWIEGLPRLKSSATRKAYADQINAAFNWAVDGRRIAENPFRSVGYPESEPRACMPDDALEKIESLSNGPFETALRFLRLTGCRLGELCNATWPEFDLDRGLWTIQKHKTRGTSRKAKMVALVHEAVELLAAIKIKAGDRKTVFVNTRGRPWHGDTLGKQLRRMKSRHGLEVKATLHGIRHQVGTEAIRNGAPLKMVSLQLGHANVAITERYYCHTDGYLEELKRAAQASLPKVSGT
jgi:integrase